MMMKTLCPKSFLSCSCSKQCFHLWFLDFWIHYVLLFFSTQKQQCFFPIGLSYDDDDDDVGLLMNFNYQTHSNNNNNELGKRKTSIFFLGWWKSKNSQKKKKMPNPMRALLVFVVVHVLTNLFGADNW